MTALFLPCDSVRIPNGRYFRANAARYRLCFMRSTDRVRATMRKYWGRRTCVLHPCHVYATAACHAIRGERLSKVSRKKATSNKEHNHEEVSSHHSRQRYLPACHRCPGRSSGAGQTWNILLAMPRTHRNCNRLSELSGLAIQRKHPPLPSRWFRRGPLGKWPEALRSLRSPRSPRIVGSCKYSGRL